VYKFNTLKKTVLFGKNASRRSDQSFVFLIDLNGLSCFFIRQLLSAKLLHILKRCFWFCYFFAVKLKEFAI
jgi:hypothetical protein